MNTKDSSEPYARKYALHEIAHAWTETNVAPGILRRFMEIREIGAWNDQRVPWKERGTEQAAEIITWGLGEGSPLCSPSGSSRRRWPTCTRS
jgi:hypothetical protein